MLTVLAAIGLGALATALLLAVREFRMRRRLAAAAPPLEREAPPERTADALEPAGATVVAPAPLTVVPEPAEAHEPEPGPRDPGHAPGVPEPAAPPSGDEITAARVLPTPEGDAADEPVPESSPVDPVRAEQVKALQRQLGVLGFDPGPVDGRYGPQTTDAVKHLQEVSGLRPDGIVGPLTAEALRHSAPEPPADDRAERVKALQRQLSWLGFEPGPADGQYGSLTTGAVRRFQEAHDLPVDGIVDRTTADTLRATVAQRPSSDRTDRVKALQRQLQWLGLEPGQADGRYGQQTTEAVRRFQEAHDLPVDGIVDPLTQRALQDSVQKAAQW